MTNIGMSNLIQLCNTCDIRHSKFIIRQCKLKIRDSKFVIRHSYDSY